jgi:hypothetical protein
MGAVSGETIAMPCRGRGGTAGREPARGRVEPPPGTPCPTRRAWVAPRIGDLGSLYRLTRAGTGDLIDVIVPGTKRLLP